MKKLGDPLFGHSNKPLTMPKNLNLGQPMLVNTVPGQKRFWNQLWRHSFDQRPGDDGYVGAKQDKRGSRYTPFIICEYSETRL